LSLTVAFEDPDSAKLKTLLADKYLFLFRNRVVVKKWKQHHKVNKETAHNNTLEHPTDDDLLDEEEDVENTLQTSDTPTFLFRNSPVPPSATPFNLGVNSNHPTAGNLFGHQLLERGKITKVHPLECNRSRTPKECSKLDKYSPPRT
jgi:hypothetical protein